MLSKPRTRKAGKLVAAYTFDAGPNAVIYYLEEYSHKVAGVFKSILPWTEGWESEFGKSIPPNEYGSLEQENVNDLEGWCESCHLYGCGWRTGES